MYKPVTIRRAACAFEREPLRVPYGFKGAFVTRLWQVAVLLESESGNRAVGLGTQSVLWADSELFAALSEEEGNRLMYELTAWATRLARKRTYLRPPDLLTAIIDQTWEHGKRITGKNDLRRAFALNSLVALDNAAWLLYARENGLKSFDEIVPECYRPALAFRHGRVASVPVISYGTPAGEVVDLVERGYFILKIKIGNPGGRTEMLARDVQLLERVHRAVGDRGTPATADGRVRYYIDANGRYPDSETLLDFLGHAERLGARERILLLEEPFAVGTGLGVGELGLTAAADEMIEEPADVAAAAELGYRAVALKPAAKTLSRTLAVALAAGRAGMACFCADLTVNPVLLEWNRNVAARLAPLPGLGLGLLETNGEQLYRDWPRLESYHPQPDGPWRRAESGVFELREDFYAASGGLFTDSRHYCGLFSEGAETGMAGLEE